MATGTVTEKLRHFIDVSMQLAKFAAVFGTLCGFVYLLAFTRNAGIPFPLNLSALPLTLLAIGAFSFGGVVVLAGGIMVPALLADEMPPTAKAYLLALDVSAKRKRTRIRRWAGCVMAPMVMAVCAGTAALDQDMTSRPWLLVLAWSLAAGAAVWFVAASFLVDQLRHERVEFILMSWMQTLLGIAAYSLLLMVAIVVYPDIGRWSFWTASAVVAVGFCVIYFMATFPPQPRLPVVGPPAPGESRSGPTSSMIAAVLAILVAFLSMIMPVNARIGGAVLQLFGIGGGMPMIVCLKSPPDAAIAKRLELDSEQCSRRLGLLFDGGDRLYFDAPAPAAGAPAAAQRMPFSIRQDDVLMKIYPGERTVDVQVK